MTKPVADIVYDFYWAASDLAANLKFILINPADKTALQQSVTDPQAALPLTIPALHRQFEKYARPFLALGVNDLPEDQLPSFISIEETLNETILPAFDVLEETWESCASAPSENLPRLRDDCDYVRCELEMNVIMCAAWMAKDMKPGIL